MTRSSAPGKIILFGEHAVVYGRPALAAPVTQVHADVEVSDSRRAGIWIDAPDIDLHGELETLPSGHPLVAAIRAVLAVSAGAQLPSGLAITVTSSIPMASGMGSGTAVSVALIRALAAHLKQDMSDEAVSAMAYEIDVLHHGTPSGIDNTVITYGTPVYFVKGRPIERLTVGARLTLVIGNTGIPAPTRASVAAVRKLRETEPARWEQVFDQIAEIVAGARKQMQAGDRASLGESMNENHALLQQLTVSSPELDRLVEAARQAGALGAKLSGGGRGGNMIALVDGRTAPRVSAALTAAGAKGVIITSVT